MEIEQLYMIRIFETVFKRISLKVDHRLVTLDWADDIVRFSFVAQNSITYLDLAQRDGRPILICIDDALGFIGNSVLDSTIKYPKYLINTEEKCRKILSTTRHCLYRLHLDLPEKRECSLKYGSDPEKMIEGSHCHHIGKIKVHHNFHFNVLSRFVEEAIKRSDNKLNMIKWLVTFDAETKYQFIRHQHVNYFVNFMYPVVTESEFVQAFLKKIDLELWMTSRAARPDYLEYFLYHLCRNRTLNDNEASDCDFIDLSIRNRSYENIGPILKYQDVPKCNPRVRVWNIYILPLDEDSLDYEALIEAEDMMGPKRFHLMMQLLYIYLYRGTPYESECLRLLWSSLSDAFFSFEEIKMALEAGICKGLSSDWIKDLYNFYSIAVGVFHSKVEPRSLKHQCRTAVRRRLWENNCWIPDGIKLTGLPKKIQSFLNLEIQFFDESAL